MIRKLLSSNTLRAALIVYVMIAASFVLMAQSNLVSAQATPTSLVVGLQNDMTTLNWFDPSTNTVWKAYQLEYDFEALYTIDPNFAVYPDLASNSTSPTCPSGEVVFPTIPGMCWDAPGTAAGTYGSGSGLNFTVFLNPNVHFTDGKAMNASDVVFTYQTLPWSTFATSIYQAIWWPQPIAPLWNSTVYGGTCAVPTGMPYACMSHTAIRALSSSSVLFQLLPVAIKGQTAPGAYALFFTTTLSTSIIPKHIWATHINPGAPANYSSSTAAAVPDTFDRSISFGSDTNALKFTTGTGPFELTSWVHNQGSVLQVAPNYWGKGISHTWNGKAYPFYPTIDPATGLPYLQEIKFVIYGSLDVVSLALQQGTIDTLIWSLTPGFYQQVATNPAITVDTVTDSGFFYLSFNMRKAPWNDLCLRQAISMAIDKNYIVNTLMGGFGVPGTVPISIINSAYINYSALPPSFDLSAIDAKLNGCGYHKDPSTGFYDTPSGVPISATILTPPKDYDPVRADAGIMISNNLKSVGLDISSAPTSFDTIVAKAFVPPVSFDLYILGWSLGPYPETYLCSFFCTLQDPNINPAGSNSAGYSNSTVDSLLNTMPYIVDNTKRLRMIQDVEGIVTQQIPWNVLYYRKNLNAFRNDRWAGWIDDPILNSLSGGGGVFNFYTIVTLHPAGSYTPSGPTGALAIAATVPQSVFANHAVSTPVYVSQNGVPVNGAAVTVTASLPSGVTLETATGTTDVTGSATVDWIVPVIQGTMFLTVSATSGSSSGSVQKQLEVTVGPPAPMATLSLSTSTPVISPGGTATVTATLIDGQGHPVAGQTVHIDRTLMLGGISPTNATTDTTGHATFTYSAPATAALFPNAHLIDTIRANVSVPDTIVGAIQTATLSIFVQNGVAPSWTILSVTGTGSGLVLNVTNPATTVTVTAKGFGGTPIQGLNITPVVSDTTNVTVSPGWMNTAANGSAWFHLVGNAPQVSALLTPNENVFVRFTTPYVVGNSTTDELALLVGSNLLETSYAAQITFSSRALAYSAGMTTDSVTAHLWDQTGAFAAGVPVAFNIPLGNFGLPAQFPFVYNMKDVGGTNGGYQNIEYAGTGLDIGTFFGFGSMGGAFQNSTGPKGPWVPGPSNITQGPAYGVENFVNDAEMVGNGNNYATNKSIDSCHSSTYPKQFKGLYFVNVTSVTNSNGVYSTSFFANPEVADQGFQVSLFVGTPGANKMNVTLDACSDIASMSNLNFTIDSGVVSQRAPVFAMGSWSLSLPVYSSQALSATMTAKFYTLSGPAANDQIFVVRGQGSATRNIYGLFGGTVTTDSTGTWSDTVKVPLLSLSQAQYFSTLPADPKYAYGARDQMFGQNPAGYGDFWFGPTFEVLLAKFPFNFQVGYLYVPTSQAFATAAPHTQFLSVGGTTQVTVTVTHGDGSPFVGANVWSGSVQAVTDDTGNATFNYTAGVGANEGLVVVTTADGQVIRTWFGVMAATPVLTYGAISANVGQAGSASTISLDVTNTLPIAGPVTVYLIVDNATVAAKSLSMASLGTSSVTFSYVFASAGPHTVSVGTAVKTLSVPSPPSALDLLTAYGLAGGLLVVGLVVGALVGIFLSRRRKQPPVAMPEEETSPGGTGGAPPAEEELGPEEKL